MIEPTLKIIESFLIYNSSLTVFIGCILEQVIAPIPASLIVLSATFIVMKGAAFSLNNITTLFLAIVLPASLGITIGSLFYYFLAYKLEMPFIDKFGKYMGVSEKDISNIEKKFKESQYNYLFIFLARCTPIIPSIAVNLFCGIIKYNFRDYLILTFVGSLVQIMFWAILAWYFGNIYIILVDVISYLDKIIMGIIVLLSIYYIITKRKEKRNL